MKFWKLVSPKKIECFINENIAEHTLNALSATEFAKSAIDNNVAENESIKIKVSKIGLSQSDFSVYSGKKSKFPIIPCRFGIGYISESSIPSLRKGMRVAVNPYNEENTLIKGYDCDGFLSDFINLEFNEIFQIPEGIDDNKALFIDDVATAINVIEKINIDKTEYIVLLGASYLNCIIGQLAVYYQAIPIIIDNASERIERAIDNGIYYSIDTNLDNPIQKILEITGGKMAECLILNTDSILMFDNILSILKQNGTFCLVGHDKELNSLNIDIKSVIKNELNVCSVNNGNGQIESAINLLANNAVNISDFIGKEYDIADLDNAFKSLSENPPYKKNTINIM